MFEAGKSVNLAVTAVVGQHSRVTVNLSSYSAYQHLSSPKQPIQKMNLQPSSFYCVDSPQAP